MRASCLRAAVAPAVAFALILAAAFTLFPKPAAAHDKLGANLNFIGDFRRNHEFADLIKQSRKFLKLGQFDDQNAANLAPIGSDGWPTSDFRIFAMAAQQNTQNLAGAYTIVFNGQATLSTSGGGAGTFTGQTFDAGTNTSRATLNFPAGAENLLIDFTGTGGTVKNLRIIRPGLNADAQPFLNPPWKAHVQRFPVVRFLDWTRTNGNRDVTWADRTTPQKLRTEAYIAQWETVIDAANWLNRDPWINVPVQANDEYVTNLAILLRDRLNANLNVYVEYGNELWNFSIRDFDMDTINGGTFFNGATVNRELAAASPANSSLRFSNPLFDPAVVDDTQLGFRRVALRLKEISDIFKTVWGAAAINTRVRPVLAGQMANGFIVSEGLRMLDEGLGVQPNSVIYAISGAPYIFPTAIPDGQADEAAGLTKQQILDGLSAGVVNAPNDNAYQYLSHAGLAAWYGLKVVAYEAGFDNFGGQNIAAKREANLDPAIRDICKNLINQWHGFGFEHILWFNAGGDNYNTPFGMWPLVEDMANQAVPKNQCMDDILAAALPPVTIGTPVLGAPIAGGDFRGSANTSGPVTGGAAQFGFPRFVEYLLRADVEGTYNLVFTGSAPAGESFRLKLNNTTVQANVTLPTTTGASATIGVTLRKGINAMRIERASGASWSIASFAFTLVGDSTPDTFSFASKTGVATGATVTSDPATINGITVPAAVTVSAGGEYSVGCTATFTAAAGTVANNETICVRHKAAASANTATVTTLAIGGVAATFTSTTAASPPPPQQFALTVTNGGNGTVVSDSGGISCGATCSANFAGGTSVTLTATPSPGFAFAGWAGSCTGIGVCQITMLGARDVTATFAAQVRLSISKLGSGSGTVASSIAGIDCGPTCAANFSSGASVTLTPTPIGGSAFAGWGGSCSGSAACTVTMDAAKTVTARFDLPGVAGASPSTVAFGGQSMNTTAPSQTVTITNTGGSSLSFTSVTASAGFGVTHTCTSLNPGNACTASVSFTPGQEGSITGSLAIVSSAGNTTVALTGTGEKSLVTHYYRSILRRAPDDGGKTFWTGEAARVQALGVNVNEVWFALALTFYTSPEYLAFNRDNTGFVTDLFSTFFNRAPDATGLAFWKGQVDQGLPREVALAAFMFSTEFSDFTQAIFGNISVRAEINTVTDFYRGMLLRLPDDGGLPFWRNKFRVAQCAANPGNAVNAEVESISSLFANSQEYANRARDTSQYVGDLFNAFLRRGGDLGGVQFWINEIAQGRRTRENVRQAFVASPEFQARVAAIINQGCLQ